MSIIRNSGDNNQQQQSNNFNQSAEAQAGANAAPAKQYSLSRLGNVTQLPFSRRIGSEAGVELARKFDDLAEKFKADNKIQTFVLDQNTAPELRFACVIVAVSEPNEPKGTVAFHTLILEGSTDKGLQPLPENISGYGQIQVQFVPGDMVTNKLVEIVTNYMSMQFPNRKVAYASTSVVPSTFNTEDPQAVHRLLGNATTAAGTQLIIHRPGFRDIDLTKVEHDAQLCLRVNSSDEHGKDAVGNPYRSDIIVELSTAPLRNSNNSNEQNVLGRALDMQNTLTNLTGYVDLMYTPPEAMAGQMGYGMAKPTQMFRPRFIITQFESVDSVSLSLQLLSLVTAAKLAENHAWIGAFQSTQRPVGKNAINFRDIGAIGFELETLPGNLPGGREIDTSPDKFTPAILRMLLAHGVYPDLTFAMDIDETGPQTWINAIFAAAGQNNERAIAALVKAANTLTGGRFEHYYDKSKPLIVAEDNRIHAGTWRDNVHTQLRDIAEFDYLAALNFYGRQQNMEAVRLFSDSHSDSGIPLKVRLDRRWELIKNALGGSVKLTGFKRRYNIHPNLLLSLVRASVDAGLQTSTDINLGEIASIQRAHLDMNQFVMGGQATGLFSGGFGSGSPNNMFNPLTSGNNLSW